MSGFEKLLDKVDRYNVNAILFEVWKDQKVKDFIIELNTIGQPTAQLYEKGINSLGVSLGNYKESTIKGGKSYLGKIAKGQRYDHITLLDTGEFYDTFFVNALGLRGFSIEADGQKEDTNLLERYGKDIIGLTDENLQILTEFIKPYYIRAAKKILP